MLYNEYYEVCVECILFQRSGGFIYAPLVNSLMLLKAFLQKLPSGILILMAKTLELRIIL